MILLKSSFSSRIFTLDEPFREKRLTKRYISVPFVSWIFLLKSTHVYKPVHKRRHHLVQTYHSKGSFSKHIRIIKMTEK